MNTDNQELFIPEQLNGDDKERQLNDYCFSIEGELEKIMSFPSLTVDQQRTIIKTTIGILPSRYIRNEETNQDTQSERHDMSNNVYINRILPWLEDGFRTDEDRKNELITNGFSDANRLICTSLILFTNKIQRERGIQTASDLAQDIHQEYFSCCPMPSFYVDISNKIELLSLASRESASRSNFSTSIAEAAIYDINFWRNKDEVAKTFENKSPIEIIDLLDVESSLAKFAMSVENRVEDTFTMIDSAIKKISDNPEMPPLVRMVALDKLENMHGGYSARHLIRLRYDKSKQIKLHSQFPSFDVSETLVAVAPGICASTRHGIIDYIANNDGVGAAIADWQPDNDLGISEEAAFLLKTAHNPSTREKIESSLRFNLSNIPLDSQEYLLRFAIEASGDRYKKLIKGLSIFDKDSEKIELINAFISTRFGEDFGDSLLSIVEHIDSSKSLEIIKIINEYHEVSKKFGELYYDFDPELASSTELAMNERLIDLLVAAETVAKDGFLKEDVSPRRNSKGYQNDGRYNIEVHSIDEIIDIMQQFLKSQQIMQDILSDSSTQITKTNADSGDKLSLGSQTYRFANKEKGFVQLHVRRRGASCYDRYNEYGNAGGTEATISWLVNPINPYKLSALKDPDCISVRFDREGRLPDEKPDSEDRSPIREDGLISIDISSVLGGPEVASNLPVRLGRIIAAGNGIRSRLCGSESSLNHNKNYFDQKYGQADNFEKIVNYITEKMERTFKKPTQAQLAELAFSLFQKSQKVNKDISGPEQYAS